MITLQDISGLITVETQECYFCWINLTRNLKLDKPEWFTKGGQIKFKYEKDVENWLQARRRPKGPSIGFDVDSSSGGICICVPCLHQIINLLK